MIEDSFFFFSSRRRHTRFDCDWSSDVCSSDLRSTTSPNRPWRIGDVVDLVAPGDALVLNVSRVIPARLHGMRDAGDRKSVVYGKSVDLGGRRIIKKKKTERKGYRDVLCRVSVT